MPEVVAKPLIQRMLNRALHTAARILPGSVSLRPALHRWRGVAVSRKVFIGDEVYLENEYPECVEIGDSSEIGLRTVILCASARSGPRRDWPQRLDWSLLSDGDRQRAHFDHR